MHRAPYSDAAPQEQDAAGDMRHLRGLTALQQWLGSLYRERVAFYDEEGIVRLSHTVAGRFGLGYLRGSVFVSLPLIEVRWARLMPWSYAAIREGLPDLFLVSAPIELDAGYTPPFGVSFSMESVARARAVANFSRLDLRNLVSTPGQEKWIVSRTPFAHMPILLLERDANVFQPNLLAVRRNSEQPRNQGRLF